jgi:hypothetical protein
MTINFHFEAVVYNLFCESWDFVIKVNCDVWSRMIFEVLSKIIHRIHGSFITGMLDWRNKTFWISSQCVACISLNGTEIK